MFLLGGATVISNFQVTALTGLKGYSEAFAGTFGTVLMIGSIIGSIFIPVLVGKLGRKVPVMLLLCGSDCLCLHGGNHHFAGCRNLCDQFPEWSSAAAVSLRL